MTKDKVSDTITWAEQVSMKSLEMVAPIVTMPYYQQPMFCLITIKADSGRYKLIDKTWLGNKGQASSPSILTIDSEGKLKTIKNEGYIREIKGYNMQKISDVEQAFKDICLERQYRLLALIHYQYLVNKKITKAIDNYRKELGIEPSMSLFNALANKHNIFFIDQYVNNNQKFKETVEKICSLIKCNYKFIEDRYTVACYFLFGDNVIYLEKQLFLYMYNKIIESLDVIRNDKSLPNNEKSFEFKLIDSIKKEISKNEKAFLERVDCLLDGFSFECGEVCLLIYSKIYLIHIVDNNSNIIKRYLQFPQEITHDFFMGTFYQALNLNNEKINRPCSDIVNNNILPLADPEIKELLKDTPIIEIPIGRITAKDAKDIFSRGNAKRKSYYGNKLKLNSKQLGEEQLQKIISCYGMFGFPKSTASELLKCKDDLNYQGYTEDQSIEEKYSFENAIYTAKSRAKKAGELGVWIKIFDYH